MFDGLDTVVQPFYVSPGEFGRWRERAVPALSRMADGSGGRYRAEDIAAALMAGGMQLWLVLDGAEIACVMVTEIILYPRIRAMRCIGIVGHRPRRWLHLLASVEKAARDCFRCGLMEALVQPGHERLLKTGGWQQFHSLWQKALA